MALPDFVVIGAMKCGTTTLAEQLAAQPGVFMTTPKEPNFFSDDRVFARGMPWYEALFDAAPVGALKGEASTHYAKLPTYPVCADRLAAALPNARLIYMVRDPFERLVSHYMHGWSRREISVDFETALDRHPELVEYGRYAMQLRPYLDRFAAERVLVLSLEAMRRDPQAVLGRVGAFLGLARAPIWREEAAQANASEDRIRRLPLHDLLISNPVADAVRRTLVPKALRQAIRRRMPAPERPVLSAARRAALAPVFAKDRRALEAMVPDLDWPTPPPDAAPEPRPAA